VEILVELKAEKNENDPKSSGFTLNHSHDGGKNSSGEMWRKVNFIVTIFNSIPLSLDSKTKFYSADVGSRLPTDKDVDILKQFGSSTK
jgi:hypothetical protein